MDERPGNFESGIRSAGAKYIDAAALLALSTAVAYIIGWIYAFAYFQRLGFQLESISLPADYYLRRAFLPVYGVLALLAFFIKLGSAAKRTRAEALWANMPFCVLFLAFCLLGEDNVGLNYTIYAISGLMLVVVLLMGWRRLAIVDLLRQVKRRGIVVPAVSVIAFIAIATFAMAIGRFQGTRRGEGIHPGTVGIHFVTKDEWLNKLQRSQLILVIQSGDYYYIVRRQQPFPALPQAFVISKEGITAVVLQRLR